MRQPLLILLSMILSTGNALAGGTVEFEEVEKILQQKPDIAKFITSSLEFEGAPLAEVRFGSHYTHLSGGRMGPYMLWAKPKGKPGNSTLEITICIAPTFLDKKGKKSADEFEAVSVSEQFTGIIIQDANETKHQVTCPTEN